MVPVTSGSNMLAWLTFCESHTFRKPLKLIIATPNYHRFGKCCCGQRSGDIEFEHVAVAHVLCVSLDIDCQNVTVAKFQVASSLSMLLWLAFGVFHAFRKIIGLLDQRQMTIDLEKIALANVLVTSLCAFHNFRKPLEFIIVTPNNFPDVCKFENDAVANALRAS